jgi:site-specific DNA recombinase
MDVGIYARVSTDDQADRQTPITDQLAACRKLAEDRAWRVAREESDDGVSGAVWPRRGLQAHLEAARRGEIRAIVMWDISRLCRRDLALFGHLLFLFQEAKCEVVWICELNDSEVEVGFKALMAAQYRKRLSEDVSMPW